MALKVLTVDDSKTIRMIVRKAFKPYDCQICEAENGVEGLAEAGKQRPDLIILDINNNGFIVVEHDTFGRQVRGGSVTACAAGVEMLDRLKGEVDLKDIPVIMLTAESGKDNVMQIVQKGVKDYMVKPFKGEDLIERVRKIVKLVPKSEDEAGECNSCKYIKQIDDIFVLTLPGKVTSTAVMVEIVIPNETGAEKHHVGRSRDHAAVNLQDAFISQF